MFYYRTSIDGCLSCSILCFSSKNYSSLFLP